MADTPDAPATEPPPLVRPAGHQFTRAEVAAMSTAEYEANRDVIRWQDRQGSIR